MNKTGLIDALNWRYATKQFDPKKKVSEEDMHELLEVLRLSPSSFGLQPWKFVVVSDPALRAKLKEHAWNQPQIVDASHLIVLCARKDVDAKLIRNYIESTSKTRNVSVESLKTYEDMMLGFRKGMSDEAVLDWSKRQAYIALGFLLQAAALKRIDACPMEGFDPKQFDEILGLGKEHLASVVLCPIGYRSESDKHAHAKKVRFLEKDVVLRK